MSETFVEHEIDENMQNVEECKQEETVNLNSEDFEVGGCNLFVVLYDL